MSDYQAYLIEMMYDIRETILSEKPIITKSELNKLILDTIENKGIVEGPVKRDLIKLLTDTDEKINEAREKFSEELITETTESSKDIKKTKKTTKVSTKKEDKDSILKKVTKKKKKEEVTT